MIGAGPAGLNAAYHGVLKGIKLHVIEAKNLSELPSRPCGEAVPKVTLDYLPKGLEKDFILNKIKRALFYFNGEYLRELKDMPLLEGFIINKHLFLKNLAEAAIAEGATITWNKFVRAEEIQKVMSDFDYIVDATGIGVIARKFLDYRNYRLIPVFQAYAKGSSIPEDTMIMWGIDRGYAWVFPRGDMYNIGAGGVYRDPKELHKVLNEIIKFFDLKLVSKIRGTAVSVGGPLKKLVSGKIRVIGEAAGMVMPTTGEGIRYALAAGKIVFEENFEKLFWNHYGKKLMNGKRLLNLLLKLKNKVKLTKMVDDKTYYEFFEGIFRYGKLLKIAVKYVFSRG